MSLRLVKFVVDCGRMGDLNGLFAATQDDLDEIVGETIEFGEVLGKHSDIVVEIAPEHFIVVDSIPEDVVELLVKEIGSHTLAGFNPFNYWEEE